MLKEFDIWFQFAESSLFFVVPGKFWIGTLWKSNYKFVWDFWLLSSCFFALPLRFTFVKIQFDFNL